MCQLEFIINSRAFSYSCQELINEFLVSLILLFFFIIVGKKHKKVLLCEQVEVTSFKHLLLNEDKVYSSLPSGFGVSLYIYYASCDHKWRNSGSQVVEYRVELLLLHEKERRIHQNVGDAPKTGGCITSFDLKYTVREEGITPKG